MGARNVRPYLLFVLSIAVAKFDFDAGDWTVQNNALLSINVTDYDPGVVNNAFDAVITLNNGDLSIITGDPRFVMNGQLNMHATSGVTVWAPTFGVLIDNQGTLRPAGFNAVGRVDAKDFQQSATGQLFLKITGRRWLVEGIS